MDLIRPRFGTPFIVGRNSGPAAVAYRRPCRATFGKWCPYTHVSPVTFYGSFLRTARVHCSYTVKDGRSPTTVHVRTQQMSGAVCRVRLQKRFFPQSDSNSPPPPAPGTMRRTAANRGRGRANVRYRVQTALQPRLSIACSRLCSPSW